MAMPSANVRAVAVVTGRPAAYERAARGALAAETPTIWVFSPEQVAHRDQPQMPEPMPTPTYTVSRSGNRAEEFQRVGRDANHQVAMKRGHEMQSALGARGALRAWLHRNPRQNSTTVAPKVRIAELVSEFPRVRKWSPAHRSVRRRRRSTGRDCRGSRSPPHARRVVRAAAG